MGGSRSSSAESPGGGGASPRTPVSLTHLCLQLGEAQAACGAARAAAQQLQRRCRRLACELEDARALAESQQSRNHELEKRQKK